MARLHCAVPVGMRRRWPGRLRTSLALMRYLLHATSFHRLAIGWRHAALVASLLGVWSSQVSELALAPRLVLAALSGLMVIVCGLLCLTRATLAVPITAMALSVGALDLMQALANGYEQQLMAVFAPLQGHAMVSAYGGGFADYGARAQQVAADPKIACALPFVVGQGVASSGMAEQAQYKAVFLKGIDREEARRCPLLMQKWPTAVESLAPATPQRVPQVVLGRGVAGALQAQVGDVLELVALRPKGRQPSERTFDVQRAAVEVRAVIDTGFDEWDQSLVWLDLHSAQALISGTDRAHGLELEVVSPWEHTAGQIAADWTAQLNQGKHLPEFRAHSWQDDEGAAGLLATARRALLAMGLLLALSCASALASAWLLALRSRRRVLAVWIALGADHGDLRRAIALFGAVLGGFGTGLGLAFATVVRRVLAQLDLPALGLDFGFGQPLLTPSWSEQLGLVAWGSLLSACTCWGIAYGYLRRHRSAVAWLSD